MDRRNFLKSTGGAAAAAAATAASVAIAHMPGRARLPAPAIGSGAKDIRVAINWPDNGKGIADSARRLAQRIEVATDRRYRLTFAASAKSAIAAVRSGEAEAYHANEHDNLDQHRGFAYFAGLPGYNGLRSTSFNAWMLAGGGQVLWDELAGEFGIKAMIAGHTFRSTGIWAARPMASLAGQKVWAMGLARDVVRGIGAEPSHPRRVAAFNGVGVGRYRGRRGRRSYSKLRAWHIRTRAPCARSGHQSHGNGIVARLRARRVGRHECQRPSHHCSGLLERVAHCHRRGKGAPANASRAVPAQQAGALLNPWSWPARFREFPMPWLPTLRHWMPGRSASMPATSPSAAPSVSSRL